MHSFLRGEEGRSKWNQIYGVSRGDSAGLHGETFDDLNVLLQGS